MSTYGNIEEITKMVLQAIDSTKANKPEFKVPVGISARHIHLTQEHVEQLFGKGYQLTKKKELMGGQFASNEQCTIVGLKLRAIENVRIWDLLEAVLRLRFLQQMLVHWGSKHLQDSLVTQKEAHLSHW